ncbi:MAG: phosphatase PAP2 family protein [Niastella sp.]|uniref:phosphatase PAP2 family protein n=1 Tax=Niastella sp. TaxID=1869183 RepID=UPI00389993CB
MKNKATLLACIICLYQYAAGQDTVTLTKNNYYERPQKWGFITHVPYDLVQIGKSPFQKKNLLGLSVVAASTAILIPYDQPILDAVKRASDHIHLESQTDYSVPLKIGDTKIIKVPRNFNSALYQLGEGGTSLLVGSGLFIFGKINKDNRALQTASDIAETFITMGVTTQVLKRMTGRESPFMRTKPGGAWRPFPSFKEYQVNTSNYDAFPSGHLATMMATVTVLTTNYPEKKWIGILGYSLIGLTGWAMVNTEVHWVADYPLALALGYISGRITCLRHKKPTHTVTVL